MYHYDEKPRTMNTLYPNGGSTGYSDIALFGSDLGLLDKHYAVTPPDDVAASSFFLYTEYDTPFAFSSPVLDQNRNWTESVKKGEWFYMPLHFINRSNKRKSIRADIYMSTDKNFTSNERIATEPRSLDPYEQIGLIKYITPNKTGKYYFGYKIVPLNGDADISNNTTALSRAITIR